jgi:hypothetical protein
MVPQYPPMTRLKNGTITIADFYGGQLTGSQRVKPDQLQDRTPFSNSENEWSNSHPVTTGANTSPFAMTIPRFN